MPIQLKKIDPVALRSIGLDEAWLQDRIIEDPGLLGLGDLEIVAREHRQPTGGRIDFLMRDAEAETYYEVEIMLGALNESHIIRSIEYWDIERQRRPQFDHRPVIVAEQITSRFFNVLRLLNRAVPMIAVKLSAFRLDDEHVALLPVTVLDIIEETPLDIVDQAERTDRGYWEGRATPTALGIMDQIVSSLRTSGLEPHLTYNRHNIPMGTTGRNFCWFRPRTAHCHVMFRVPTEMRDSILSELQDTGIDASARRGDYVAFQVTPNALNQYSTTIIDVLKKAEAQSH